MFDFFKRKKPTSTTNDLTDEHGNVIHESSVIYNKNKKRYLKLNDDCCAMVIHPDDNVEIIFTKLYDPEQQEITDNEETLMALALFMKQPGFGEMLKEQFRKIAMENISDLTNQK